jgi:hypothetical protein
VFNGQTTSTYAFTTSIPEPKLSQKRRAGHAETSTDTITEIVEKFRVASLFRQALELKEADAADNEPDNEISYSLYIAESKRHECHKLKIMICGEEIAALLDTGCEMSILNEQLYSKLRL